MEKLINKIYDSIPAEIIKANNVREWNMLKYVI
jgi:hypothetical protein